jgi:hypothetical protein
MGDEPATASPAETAAAIWRCQIDTGVAWLEAWMEIWRSVGVKPAPQIETAIEKLKSHTSS